MGTLGQSGLPHVSAEQGGPTGGRWEIRAKPRKPRRTGRMPTWLALLIFIWAFVSLFANPPGTLDAVAFASLFCLAALFNFCAGLLADRDEHRRAARRRMYVWDWIALGVSAIGGGAALLLTASESHEFDLGLWMAALATILGLCAAKRHRLAASEPSLVHVEDVFR